MLGYFFFIVVRKLLPRQLGKKKWSRGVTLLRWLVNIYPRVTHYITHPSLTARENVFEVFFFFKTWLYMIYQINITIRIVFWETLLGFNIISCNVTYQIIDKKFVVFWEKALKVQRHAFKNHWTMMIRICYNFYTVNA